MEYVVQPGDTLSAIARRFGVGLAALLSVNPEVADPDLIFPGQVIRIPLFPPGRPPAGRFLYVVQPGDTLAAIAQRLGVDLTTLLHANPQIADPDVIFPGQVLFVPLPRVEGMAAPLAPGMPMERPMPMGRPMEMPEMPGMPCPMEMPVAPLEMEMEMEMPMRMEMPMGMPMAPQMPGIPRPQARPVPPEHERHHRG